MMNPLLCPPSEASIRAMVDIMDAIERPGIRAKLHQYIEAPAGSPLRAMYREELARRMFPYRGKPRTIAAHKIADAAIRDCKLKWDAWRRECEQLEQQGEESCKHNNVIPLKPRLSPSPGRQSTAHPSVS